MYTTWSSVWLPVFYFVWARWDWLLQRQSWPEKSLGGRREKQLHWVGCTKDKAPLWHQSWPHLRHWLCDSMLDNLVQNSCSFMPDVFRPHTEAENCWTLSPKWHKYVWTHDLMVMWQKGQLCPEVAHSLSPFDFHSTADIVCSWFSR